MSRRTNIIDSDGVERLETLLDREDVQLEDDEEGAKYENIRKWVRYAFYSLILVVGVVFVGVTVWGVQMLISGNRDREVVRGISDGERLRAQALTSDEIARAFIAETDPQKRLSYVRNKEVVKGHLARYPEQALRHPVNELKLIGHRIVDDVGVSAYSVRFANGDYRMLSVVDSGGEAKVDWDSYARYCSATWEELFTGGFLEADVRVFVRPGDYYVGQFRDKDRWVCFLLETPDCDRSIYAYAVAGKETTGLMQRSIMQSEKFRRHMTLKLESKAGSHGERLFVIKDLLAMGWVVK